MAFVVLVINVPASPIGDLNNKTQFPGNTAETLSNLQNLLHGINGGNTPAAVQVTVRDTDPAVATSGTGSTQNTYDHR